MKKISFIFFVLIVFSCNKEKKTAYSESETADSAFIYIRLSKGLNVEPNKKVKLIDKAYDLVLNSKKNNTSDRDNLFYLSHEYYKVQNWKKFNTLSSLLLKKANTSNDTINLVKTYRYIAGYYKNTQIYDSSFYYYLKAEKLYKAINQKENYAIMLLNKSIVQYAVNDFLGADISLKKSITIFRKADMKQELFGAYVESGIVSFELKEYDNAIKFQLQALEILENSNLEDSENQKSLCLNNLAIVYQNLSNYDKAIENYQLALDNPNIKNDDPDLYSRLLDNLAYSKLKSNKLDNLPDEFYNSLKIRDSLNSSTPIILSYLHLSEYYEKQKDTSRSILFATNALKLSKANNVPVDILASLKQAAVVDQKNASNYTTDYIRINDSLQDAERRSKDRFARIQLQTDEIIEENSVLQLRNRYFLLSLFGMATIFGFMFIIKSQRAKNRELIHKQAQQQANEEIYNIMISQQATIDRERVKEKKRIAQELHDGVLGRMFGTRLNLDSLNNRADNEATKDRLTYLSELKLIEQDIREISHDLNREKYVLINNFVIMVNNLIEEQNNSHSSKVTSNIDNTINWNEIINTTKINLYRILQESFQNINKYAKAKKIKIELLNHDGNIILSIQDDGIGFDVIKKRKGIGLQNITARTKECKGYFEIISEKNNGTQITITLPIELNQQVIT